MFARDARNSASVSAWRALAASSPCSAVVAYSSARCPSARAVAASAAWSQDSRQADSARRSSSAIQAYSDQRKWELWDNVFLISYER